MVSSSCPCGSGRQYAHCCGPAILGLAIPATAEALMRSRYTAFSLGDEAYLLKTWHPSTRPAALSLSQQSPLKWIGLKILATHQGGEHDSEGTVEFIARYKVNGKADRLHEISQFMREGDRWFYLHGQTE